MTPQQLAIKVDILEEILRAYWHDHSGDHAWLDQQYDAHDITMEVRHAYDDEVEGECESREAAKFEDQAYGRSNR